MRKQGIIAALSFEERCLAAVRDAIRGNESPSSVTMLDYGSSATPGAEASTLRHRHWSQIQSVAEKQSTLCTRYPINSTSMADLEEIVERARLSEESLLIDISCMTRPHVLGLAVQLAKDTGTIDWQIAYTKPLSYGDLNAASSNGGWRDSLWLALGEDSSLRNQGLAIGLVAVGHEADRTAIALREIEPAAGIAIYTCRRDRPDLHRASLEQNRLLFSYLKQLRMPGQKGKPASRHFENGGWEVVGVQMEQAVKEVTDVVKRVVDAAIELDSPLFFAPFGPKLIVFIVGWLLAKQCPERSWAIYPVARTHPVGYSDGILATEVLHRDLFEASRRRIFDT